MKKLLLLLLLSFNVCSEPIEFVVTTSAGGPNDTVSRKIADKITEQLGLEMLVINKPGAASVIGYNYILNSKKPTIFISTNTIVGNPLLGHVDMLYELGWYSNVVYVSSKSNLKSWNDVVKLSKKRSINFGHGGVGTASYQSMLTACEKIDCLPVPFKSGADGMLNILNGTIDAYALISYGSEAFSQNNAYRKVLNIQPTTGDNWVMLFGKNLPTDVASDIVKVVSKMEKIK